MSTTELPLNWSMLSLEEIEARLQAGTDHAILEQLLGAEEAEDLVLAKCSHPFAFRAITQRGY